MILPAEYTFSKNEWPWANFAPNELACKHCGEQYYWPEFMDRLQTLRNRAGQAVNLNSGHRCRIHNALEGGAIFSQHLRLAADIRLDKHNRKDLAKLAMECGFTGLGYYNRFLHVDLGRSRYWFGKGARASWE